jgi:DNA-binding SARP family transcriptional activator/Flp pilus assembly protein TadD
VRPKARAQAGNTIMPSREAMLDAKASSNRSQETSVGIKLEASVQPSLQMRLLGSFAIARDGVELKIPSSRKVRGLLAYLSLTPHASTRSQLCELLWDVPNDPRGELRWCLSKIRAIVDDPDRKRVDAKGDLVRLDLSDCQVDAIAVVHVMQGGIGALSAERLKTLSGYFAGDFLEGLEIDRAHAFNAWLAAQRRRFRAYHAALLEHLARTVPDGESFGYIEQWIALAPFDLKAHELLFTALARRGAIREAEEHLSAATRSFEADGLDAAPLQNAWRTAREQARSASATAAAKTVVVTDDGPISPILAEQRRASIAVMPFSESGMATSSRGGPADAFAHDIITRLAKLRSLFIIAQGTVFTLHERHIGPEEAGRTLNVDYVVGGSIVRQGTRLTVSVELMETRTARVVWAEVFTQPVDDAFLVLDEIGNRIVASIASEIETIERNRAILKPPNSLDAWEAHHRGLWHMYRFRRDDNRYAQHFFETAIRLDPTFARAYAGLSFTHFQNAFQGWEKREPAIERALEFAGQSVMADERDPTAHWAMGRALWLGGRHDQSIVELEQAVDLSPNFAVGHYTLAFVHSQIGDAERAVRSSDHSRELSPYDPFLFGMMGARSMALVRLGRFDEAADWGVKAAARPNAFPHILAIAAYSLALAGRLDEARVQIAAIQKAVPGYRVDDFLTGMQFDERGAALYRKAAKLIGAA